MGLLETDAQFLHLQPTNQPTNLEVWVKVASTPKVGTVTLELPTVAQTSLLQISHFQLRTGQELVLLSQTLWVLPQPHEFHPGRAAPSGKASSTRNLSKMHPLETVAAPDWPNGKGFLFQGLSSGQWILCSSNAVGSSRNTYLAHMCTDFAWAFTMSFPISADNLCNSAQRDICSQASPLAPEGCKKSRWKRKRIEPQKTFRYKPDN